MAERLTDAALGRMESYVMATRDCFGRFSTNDVEALLQEIRESRSASISAVDREALECLPGEHVTIHNCELAMLVAEVRELRSQLDRYTRVVEAAREWRKFYAMPTDDPRWDETEAWTRIGLQQAVDALDAPESGRKGDL
jgi:hypothetical protein